MEQRFLWPFIGDKKTDFLFILGPAYFSIFLAFFLFFIAPETTEVTLIPWIIFVLLIDVAHVYSSLYKTYLHPIESEKKSSLFLFVPIACFCLGLILYTIKPLFFWRSLAYLAVFHFIRQQYGFMRIYSRGDLTRTRISDLIDAGVIYLATIYPLLYWHTNLPRNFSWFIENDFFLTIPHWLASFAGGLYALCIFLYVSKDLISFYKKNPINVPKSIFILGTGLSWWVGIVHFNSDLIFTMTNVVSHGIPYFALIWINGKKEFLETPSLKNTKLRYVFSVEYAFAIFLGFLFLISFMEEGLWAGLVWREHLNFFSIFSYLPVITEERVLAWIVPLLTLPQMVHYTLDGFIWKKSS